MILSLHAFYEAGYMSCPAWTQMYQLAPYCHSSRIDLCVAESLASGLINLPSIAVLVEGQLE
jgi:hypothetical protein